GTTPPSPRDRSRAGRIGGRRPRPGGRPRPRHAVHPVHRAGTGRGAELQRPTGAAPPAGLGHPAPRRGRRRRRPLHPRPLVAAGERRRTAGIHAPVRRNADPQPVGPVRRVPGRALLARPGAAAHGGRRAGEHHHRAPQPRALLARLAGGGRERAAEGGGRDRGRHIAAADAAERVFRRHTAQQRADLRASRSHAEPDPAIGRPRRAL
ncbi:MAG: hypothetical protein AVDCRST_MAG04-3809, partial [uncultured Acetobacteraceae bacterium]